MSQMPFSDKQKAARKVLGLMDLTSLNDNDTDDTINQLCRNAKSDFGSVAAICIYPQFIPLARQALAEKHASEVKIATVVNFPDGGDDVQVAVDETRKAVELGADEVDLVFPYRQFMQGNTSVAKEMINLCKQACPSGVLLKVIIESGELNSPDLIRSASDLAINAGADFIKTSTGKVPVNATIEAAELMLQCIKSLASKNVGFKAAGGIRTMDEAISYLEIADNILGRSWVDSTHFRFGASSLLTSVNQWLGASDDSASSESNVGY